MIEEEIMEDLRRHVRRRGKPEPIITVANYFEYYDEHGNRKKNDSRECRD